MLSHSKSMHISLYLCDCYICIPLLCTVLYSITCIILAHPIYLQLHIHSRICIIFAHTSLRLYVSYICLQNITGLHRLLDNLREMSAGVSETKLFALNEAVDLNTKKMCTLQIVNEKSANTLYILQILFGGILAFDILDRITGKVI